MLSTLIGCSYTSIKERDEILINKVMNLSTDHLKCDKRHINVSVVSDGLYLAKGCEKEFLYRGIDEECNVGYLKSYVRNKCRVRPTTPVYQKIPKKHNLPEKFDVFSSLEELKLVSTEEVYIYSIWDEIGSKYNEACLTNKKCPVIGTFKVEVSIYSDGRLKSIKILSENHDDKSINAIKSLITDSAPFNPFPDELFKVADIIEIVRTVNFQLGEN